MSESIVVVLDRENVECMNIEPVLQALQVMAVNAASARAHANRVRFAFEGYDGDGEVYLDPTVRAFVGALTERFPYWLHFAAKNDDTLFVILNCLAPAPQVDSAGASRVRVQIDGAAWGAQLGRLFGHMNSLYKELGLTAEENSTATQAVKAWLDGIESS